MALLHGEQCSNLEGSPSYTDFSEESFLLSAADAAGAELADFSYIINGENGRSRQLSRLIVFQ